MDNNTNFSFFSPIKLSKGEPDNKGKSKMIVSGIASTSSKDADGEFLDPKGFDLSYFLDKGFINWNHGKSPLERAIGKPLEKGTEIKDGDMVLRCELFPESGLAQEVYQLGEILEAQGLSLGYSIEGEVIERDPMDSRRVTKAKITSCAITPNPKNQDAVAELAKGHGLNELNNNNNNKVDSNKFDYQKLIDADPNLTGSQLNAISTIMNTSKSDELLKALEVLGLEKAPVKETEVLEKGMNYGGMSTEEMLKAMGDMKKAYDEKMKKAKDSEEDKDKDEKPMMSKGIDELSTLIKGEFNGLKTKNESRDILVKSLLNGLDQANKSNDELKKSLADLAKRLDTVESTPNQQKSVVGTVDAISKGFDSVPTGGVETTEQVISASNKKTVIGILDNVVELRKGQGSNTLADALDKELCAYESMGVVGSTMKKELDGLKIKITQ